VSLAIIPLYLYALAMFLLPGFVVALVVRRTQQLRGTYALILIIVCGGVLGYLAFWVYFANKSAGRIFSYSVPVVSLVFLSKIFVQDRRRFAFVRELSLPLIYLAIVGALYLSVLFVVADPFATGQDLMDWRFFKTLRPGDNIIPWLFASKIYEREPLIPFCCGDWLSSDRPPLQAGIFLLFWPLKAFASAGLYYQLLASGLQCLWICAAWVLLKTLGGTTARTVQILGLLIPCSFFFYNSLYTWPKLLAASFVLFAISICATALIERRKLTTGEVLLGGCCVGLALMAHPGSLFSLPLAAVILLANRGASWRALAGGVCALLCFAVPWMCYQRYFDPPGNRLLKMHLAGVISVDSRSTWQALKDSYGSLTPEQVLTSKWKNVLRTVGPEPMGGLSLHVDLAVLEDARILQRETIWNAIGILNAGWIAAAIMLWRRRAPPIRYAHSLLVLGLSNLFLWCLIIFGPVIGTRVEHSSYADLMLIALGLSAFLVALPRWVVLSLFGAEIVNLIVVWLPFRPIIPFAATVTQWPLVGFGVLSAAALFVFTARSLQCES
jgi:hypothetical protein